MVEFFEKLDRRWIYLAVLLAVAAPILSQQSFPEKPTKPVLDVFKYIEELPEGSNILISFDYSANAEGELEPMATAVVRHCCIKRHRMIFMTLYAGGPPMIDETISKVIETEFAEADLKYGTDYINLGFNNAQEVVIAVMATDLQKMFPHDFEGTPLDKFPITENITSL
ncbi:MAG: hypothetical protein JSS02_19010, partial [Planctomycetes bacterium]|nr:hypothetical protein [Planctomycetota bacterium]